MGAEVFEEPLEFEIAILEAISPGSAQYLDTSYPYPALLPTSAIEKRTLRSVVLENAFLRATILPDLGGRLISLFDKRVQRDVLPMPRRLAAKAGGPRGAYLAAGIEIVSTGEARLNALGVTTALLENSEDEESSAGVWIGEVAGPLSFNALWSLEPDAAVLTLEVRFLNRTLRPVSYSGGVSATLEGASQIDLSNGAGLYSPELDSGLAIIPQSLPFEGIEFGGGRLLMARAPLDGVSRLSGRQSDSWTVDIVPWVGIGPAVSVSEAAILTWGEERMSIHAARPQSGAKVVLLTAAHGAVEAPLDLKPGAPFTIAFEKLPSRPEAAALIDEGKRELLRYEPSAVRPPVSRSFWHETAEALAITPRLSRQDTDENLKRAKGSLLTRTPAHLLLGARHLGSREYDRADAEFGDALLFNGDDPLAWWAKALAKRLGDESGEIPELLNAHFLAPLEPALRAEGILTQATPDIKGPNPILAPLAEAPEQFVDVACLLLDLGLHSQAARFMEEALLHADLPMLRYLLAHVVASEPQMEVESAQHVKAAAALGFRPPYPWREQEVEALQSLGKRFPNDTLVRRFLDLAQDHGQRAHNLPNG